jgi:hypothetical protein
MAVVARAMVEMLIALIPYRGEKWGSGGAPASAFSGCSSDVD